jgi:SAM-dependent methyltransferase
MTDRSWPGRDRREPSRAHWARLTLRPLSLHMQRAVAEEVAPRGTGQSVLDIGCFEKPYYPYFAPVSAEYVGLDVVPGPHVDVVGPAERLPFPDAAFDVVVSTQMLEHCLDPGAVLAEAHRVLKPGGVLLLSTHGTAAYHPFPTDLWRWTQEGFVVLLERAGSWASIDVRGAGGTAACFGYLIGFYLNLAFGSRRLVRLPLVVLVNLLFGALDRVVPLHYPHSFTLISNFFVVARKPG